jgi:hypothetical protein
MHALVSAVAGRDNPAGHASPEAVILRETEHNNENTI